MRLRASAANNSGMGKAGLSAAKTARLQRGNALATPSAAKILNNHDVACAFPYFQQAIF